MTKLVIATNNKDKKKELEVLLKGLKLKILDLGNLSRRQPVKEDGLTFKENAVKKAKYAASKTGKLSIADDSGLEVYILGGLPGVRSARFAGRKKDDRNNCLKLLRLLEGIPLIKRKARFVCAAAVADKNGFLKTVQGTCPGHIGLELKGGLGFGYDPVFIPRGYKKTFAQLGPEIKNKISHRFLALKKAKKVISQYLLKYS